MANTKKGIPKRDGSGKGNRNNINRGECNNPQTKGKGSNRNK